MQAKHPKSTGATVPAMALMTNGGCAGRVVKPLLDQSPNTFTSTRRLASLCSLFLGSGKSIWELPNPW